MSWSGGCQCGAVRFRVDGDLGEASICHCRMCQKATGSFFGPYVSVQVAELSWTRGERKRFQSSNKIHRGFCGDCGTPLTFEHGGSQVSVAIGAFDDPASIRPTEQLDSPSRLPWFEDLAGLPTHPTDEPSGEVSGEHRLLPAPGPRHRDLAPGSLTAKALASERSDRCDQLVFEPEAHLLADGQVLEKGGLADGEGLRARGPVQHLRRLVGDSDAAAVGVDRLDHPDDFRLRERLCGLGAGRWRAGRRRAASCAATTSSAAAAMASPGLGFSGCRRDKADHHKGKDAFQHELLVRKCGWTIQCPDSEVRRACGERGRSSESVSTLASLCF